MDARDRVLTPGLISHPRPHRRLTAGPLVHRGSRQSPVLVLRPLRDAAGAQRGPGRGGRPRVRGLLDGRAAAGRRHHRHGDRRAGASTWSSAPPTTGSASTWARPSAPGAGSPGTASASEWEWNEEQGRAGPAPRGGLPREARRRPRRPRALLLLAGPDRHLHARAAQGSQALRGRGARAVPGAHLAVGGGVQRDGGPPRQDADRLDARAGRARARTPSWATRSSSAARPGRTTRRATWRSWRTPAARWPTRSGSSRDGAWPWSRSRATVPPASTCRSAPTPIRRA